MGVFSSRYILWAVCRVTNRDRAIFKLMEVDSIIFSHVACPSSRLRLRKVGSVLMALLYQLPIPLSRLFPSFVVACLILLLQGPCTNTIKIWQIIVCSRRDTRADDISNPSASYTRHFPPLVLARGQVCLFWLLTLNNPSVTIETPSPTPRDTTPEEELNQTGGHYDRAHWNQNQYSIVRNCYDEINSREITHRDSHIHEWEIWILRLSWGAYLTPEFIAKPRPSFPPLYRQNLQTAACEFPCFQKQIPNKLLFTAMHPTHSTFANYHYQSSSFHWNIFQDVVHNTGVVFCSILSCEWGCTCASL